MAERLRNAKTVSRIERALKNATVAEKGNVACIDTADGSLVPVSVATTLVALGWFEDSFTGDGTTIMGVTLFDSIECVVMINSSTGPVADADVGKNCYLHSGFEVSMAAAGKSVLGRVLQVIGSGAGAKVVVQTALAGA